MVRAAALAMLVALAVAGTAPGVRAIIVGEDDRQQVTQTDQAPWRAIAWLSLQDEAGEHVTHCTGSLISPDTVLTAAHCLFNPDIFFPADGPARIRVVPGKSGIDEPFGSTMAESWWVPEPWVASGGRDFFTDWALIKLQDPIGASTGWFNIAVLSDKTLLDPGANPVLIGYPADKPEGTMWAASEPAFKRVEFDFLWYLVDAAPGQSGSAVFFGKPTSPYRDTIVAIHSIGRETVFQNAGTRITGDVLAGLLEGCRALGCAFEFVIEPAVLPYRAVVPALARTQ